MQAILDGHNDALCRLWCAGDDPVARFAQPSGHVNTPAAQAGGLRGGMFALFAPPHRAPYDFSAISASKLPKPEPMTEAGALQAIMAQVGIARRLHASGALTLCTTAAGVETAMKGDSIAAVLHLEGAECIDPDLLVLDALHGLGLRSLGPVWSRPTIWGEGVPFGFGRDGDTGPGLTEAGKRLVARCAELRMVVDTSHLTMKGFFDIADMGMPLVATHSNAFDICPATRNLTQAQLRVIGESGGMAGLNFARFFLRSKGGEEASLDDCLRHLDAMIETAGEEHVGLGSDFDGGPLPQGLSSAADLPALVSAMERHGFGAPLIDRICRGNWLDFLRRTLGA